MIDIQQRDDGILVDKKFLFTSVKKDEPDCIVCALECGEDVKYGLVEKSYIDYPGEYQQGDMIIFCILSKDNKLNYIIKSLNFNFALVQDAKAVNAHAFEDVTDVIALGEWISLQLQKLDLQCNIISS